MRLAEFFAKIGPFLEGKETHAEATRALYPPGSDERDVKRLAIYGRFCRTHRSEALEFTFSYCRAVIERQFGDEGWRSLVESYFRAHPMFHVELNENGVELGSFLEGYAPANGLPSWLPELADFEWWEWRTRIAPEAEGDARAGEGPLRLASTVELRPYHFDLVTWCDGDRSGEPVARDTVVLFWRDAELDLRRELCSPIELAALKMAAEGLSVADLAKKRVDRRALEEARDDLRAAGAILGTIPRR